MWLFVLTACSRTFRTGPRIRQNSTHDMYHLNDMAQQGIANHQLPLFGVRDHLSVKYNLLQGHSCQGIFDDAILPS
ncbi:hypothetical protein SCLCIDRAFT_1209211 [Scleroderma citrinum Foug A]|uniref:Uncharacterized protein n=1 Tax=Scleroderma citrinum Foug A TaxID=1036808 RepID=A0A0C3A3Z7_9AGAM|nr:hypothetical protein SCLCIDRAFT_1209211 [Scleroderma citrinum Foug A]